MPRDNLVRLVRRHWGASECLKRQQAHSWIDVGCRNDLRPRTNRDQRPSAASQRSLLPRRLPMAEPST